MSTPENVQRVGLLGVVPGILRSFGADPVELLAAAGLSADALDNPEATIPYAAMGHLLELAADKTQCPHFGLLIGERIGTASLGLVGELMRNAPTLGVALQDLATHQHRDAHGSVVYLLKIAGQAFFGYAIYQPDILGNSLLCDGAAMAACNIIRELSQPGPVPVTEVLLSRAEPLDLIPYRRLFSSKLRFNADQTAVVLPASSLDRPVLQADAGLRKILEKRVAAHWLAGDLDIVTRLRRTLRLGLVSDRVSSSEIAAEMGMTPRTLYRRLGARGFHFQQILNETRCEFAKQLLAGVQLGIVEVGRIVGYADPAVFTRAFIRWEGVTPSEWRAGLNARRTMTHNSSRAATASKS
jgi:AraC-like DNA-binding protein